MKRVSWPSPAMMVAVLALFVALGGTAIAAGVVPLAKRALVADNAKMLQGKTATQLLAQPAAKALEADKLDGLHAEQVAALPSPAATAGGLVAIKTAAWNLSPRAAGNFTVMCDAGQKVMGGGWADPGDWSSSYQSMPTADGNGWTINIYTSSYAPGGQSGTVYAMCLK